MVDANVPFDPETLDWAEVPRRGGGVKLQAKFPWAHLEAYVVAQQNKGLCTFTTEAQIKPRTVDELLAGGAKQIKNNTPLFQCTWRSQRLGRCSTMQRP